MPSMTRATAARWFSLIHAVTCCCCSEREIQFFELSSFDGYCQINSIETVPLRLDYWYVIRYVTTSSDVTCCKFTFAHACVQLSA